MLPLYKCVVYPDELIFLWCSIKNIRIVGDSVNSRGFILCILINSSFKLLCGDGDVHDLVHFTWHFLKDPATNLFQTMAIDEYRIKMLLNMFREQVPNVLLGCCYAPACCVYCIYGLSSSPRYSSSKMESGQTLCLG
jgi:hypothetical protein